MKKLLMVIMGLLFSSASFATPSFEELRSVTVKITNSSGNSGGSGTILRSSQRGSTIITNLHVCELTEAKGGYVVTNTGKFAVQQILKDANHDLCLVYVTANLKQNSKVAENTPKVGSKIIVSGHPFLMPHMVVEGHLSSVVQAHILTDVVKCTEKDYEQNEDLCFWFGGIPVIREYNAITTSAIIAPGNSGSAVYNDDGEIIALVFAGTGRGMSPGILVPHEYLVSFLASEKNGKWTNVSGGRKVGQSASQGSKKHNNTVNTVDLSEIVNIDVFSASKDPKLDRLYNKILDCKGALKSCLTKQ